VRDLSYKPAKYNTKYQRASISNSTVFYGSIFKKQGQNFYNANESRIVGLCETSFIWRNHQKEYGIIKDGEELITFGKWDVLKDLTLAVIFNHDEFIRNNEIVKSVADSFINMSKDMPEDIIDKSKLISRFFANEFAKKDIDSDSDYLISSIYADYLLNSDELPEPIHGILYPSVRAEGKGCNVAINSKYVDSFLSLSNVVECIVYSNNNKVVIDNHREANVKFGSDKFKLNLIPYTTCRLGRERVFNSHFQ
jgi:hypothetical protein